MLRLPRIGFPSQAFPEGFIRIDRLSGIKTFQEKFFQFLLGSLEARSGSDLHCVHDASSSSSALLCSYGKGCALQPVLQGIAPTAACDTG